MTNKIKIYHNKPIPSEQAIKLKEALERKSIYVELEQCRDGNKHVDLNVPSAKLDIEVDGAFHLLDSKQILADIGRGYYSHKDGFNTIHIPNKYIDLHLEELAHSLAEAIKTIEYRLHVN